MNKGGSTPGIPNPWTLKLGSDGVIKVDADLDNIRIAEIAPIHADTNAKVDSDSKLDLKVEPLDVTSNSVTNSTVDLKPVAIDSCQTIKIAPLPPMRMEQPWTQRFGFVFMGVELFGFTSTGSYETLLNRPPAAAPAGRCRREPDDGGSESSKATPRPGMTRNDGGLRVRIGGK